MRLLITGGCGFLGSNLAAHALKNADIELTVFDNLSRTGAALNLNWLRTLGNFYFIYGDSRNSNDVNNLIRTGFDVVFHLAGQVAMTTSIANPRLDFETNALGTFNILDAIRKYSPKAIVTFSSTNKVYGDLEQFHYDENDTRYTCVEYPKGFPEDITLDFHSPYGCSKGAADQYMLDFARIYGMKTIVFRHSSMYGGRQFATYDQGWIGWFCQKALETEHDKQTMFTISGNGKQVRDILHAEDIIALYFSVIEHADKMAGNVYNIGGGMDRSLSLLELFTILENKLHIKLNYTQLPPRASDQKIFVADITKIHEACGWEPKVSVNSGIDSMLNWAEDMK